jgi:glycosyltransferase involved in cell wall biosynthesis
MYHQGDEWLASYLFGNKAKRAILNLFSPIRFHRERKIDIKNVTLVSHFMKGRFVELGFPAENLSVIHRGFEQPLTPVGFEDRFSPPVFLVASRLALYKGIQIAIRGASSLDRQLPDEPWEMWIAGGAEPETVEYFEQSVVKLGLQHRVKFLGKLTRDQVIQHMRRATAFISPSVFDEPFGNTNIEAMAAGAPLIAARSGAIEEIVVNTECGLIYNRTSDEELAAHMKLILQQPSVGERLSAQGIERVQNHFTQDHIIGLVEDSLYRVSGVSQPVTQDQQATLR